MEAKAPSQTKLRRQHFCSQNRPKLKTFFAASVPPEPRNEPSQ